MSANQEEAIDNAYDEGFERGATRSREQFWKGLCLGIVFAALWFRTGLLSHLGGFVAVGAYWLWQAIRLIGAIAIIPALYFGLRWAGAWITKSDARLKGAVVWLIVAAVITLVGGGMIAPALRAYGR